MRPVPAPDRTHEPRTRPTKQEPCASRSREPDTLTRERLAVRVPRRACPSKVWVSKSVWPSKVWVSKRAWASKVWVPKRAWASKVWVPKGPGPQRFGLPQNVENHRLCNEKHTFWNAPVEKLEKPRTSEMQPRAAARSLPPHAPGARIT